MMINVKVHSECFVTFVSDFAFLKNVSFWLKDQLT